MHQVKNMTKALKTYDKNLYCQETKPGRRDVYRKSEFGCNPPHFLFSLTDDWKPTGRPVEYGTLVVIDRIKAADLWRDDSFVENYIKSLQKIEESKDRALKNNIEDFLYVFAGQFQKATNDVNTANLKKLYRKEDSNGYCQPRP